MQAWRRMPSRESDAILQEEAIASNGAILTSFWRLPGMPSDSGTPLDWLAALPDRVVNIQCVCEPETAAERFVRRVRHPGHLDCGTYAEVLASLLKLPAPASLEIGRQVLVNTSSEPKLDDVVRAIKNALDQ